MDMPAQQLSRRLQRTLLAFFCLSALFLVVVYAAAPSIYTNTLSLMPSPAGRSPVAATLLLGGVGVFLAIVMIGVLRRWRSRVLARAGGFRRDDPRYSGHALAADGDPASSVPALVQSVSHGRLPDRGRHCRVDVPAQSASWSVGYGQESLIRCTCP